MPECYVRGSTIKYLRIPDEVIDMVKEEVVQKSKGRGEMRGRGGPQRGRGGRGKLDLYLREGVRWGDVAGPREEGEEEVSWSIGLDKQKNSA